MAGDRREQLSAVSALVAQRPLTPDEVAESFSGAKKDLIARHLEILSLMGEIVLDRDGRVLGMGGRKKAHVALPYAQSCRATLVLPQLSSVSAKNYETSPTVSGLVRATRRRSHKPVSGAWVFLVGRGKLHFALLMHHAEPAIDRCLMDAEL